MSHFNFSFTGMLLFNMKQFQHFISCFKLWKSQEKFRQFCSNFVLAIRYLLPIAQGFKVNAALSLTSRNTYYLTVCLELVLLYRVDKIKKSWAVIAYPKRVYRDIFRLSRLGL